MVAKFTFKNNKEGFDQLLTTINSLSSPEDIRIGFESTSHYALNLELFLENASLTFMEVNPVLISEYKKSTTLRRTKTDSVDCESIARWLMTVEYKPHSKGFYHAYSLKSLTRLRDIGLFHEEVFVQENAIIRWSSCFLRCYYPIFSIKKRIVIPMRHQKE
ncbi:transposase [Butyrivibrio sp. INlla16]|uniref:IS110 family transposase n=1 Tax=Butyrivibrio sp. INlla16 TaxID=1520807 RepID=UPI00241D6168